MKTRQIFIHTFLLASMFFILSFCTKESYEDGRAYNNSNIGIGLTADGYAFEGTGTAAVDPGGEGYEEYKENSFITTLEESTSTFSIDADGGSYSNTRRFLNSEQLPPRGAIRSEEFMNYFNFDYPEPDGQHPIALNGEISSCPWNTQHKLLRIGIQGKSYPKQELPRSNFVFLIDVSGSMASSNKLELLKEGFKIFTDQLDDADRVSIVTYAGQSGVLLPSTLGSEKETIKAAIDQLGAGGSTAGAEGIITAYDIALQNFIEGGNNRVVLGTDGDFNVGVSSQEGLVELIEEKRELGVFLTVLGVGTGNYQDAKMEQLANNGNGTYEYLDNLDQAKKVLVYEFQKFFAVAKDVKVQVYFNPDVVFAYRLIGYENRLLENEDFEDDEKDAGEIGAGQNITALYEIIPSVMSLPNSAALSVDFRYKLPDADISIPLSLDIIDSPQSFHSASEHMRFAACAAGFGMLLWESEYSGDLNYDKIINWASNATSYDPYGFRGEFIQLVNKAKEL
jgi:Ca-activated chloride channel family protein